MKKMLVFIIANPFVGCFNALEFHFSSSWKKHNNNNILFSNSVVYDEKFVVGSHEKGLTNKPFSLPCVN